MQTRQITYSGDHGWEPLPSNGRAPDLVLLFGGRQVLQQGTALADLRRHVPAEVCFGCSTAGEIEGSHLRDHSVVATAVWFDKAHVGSARVQLSEVNGSSDAAGALLAERLDPVGLTHVFILSDGMKVNGTALVEGLKRRLPATVTVSGGLSGDGEAMTETVVCHAGQVEREIISAVGFYGEVHVGAASVGGFTPFGPVRKITKSEGNLLQELDGEPALAVYKRYLAEHAAQLPASALLFPLHVSMPEQEPVVRTIVGVDEAKGTLNFVGDVPTGARAQLMRANFERLVGAGEEAATRALTPGHPPELVVLVSCICRRMVLKQRVEEELDAVRSVFGESITTTGFYSYGELGPARQGEPCRLHNQTMTVTTFSES